jgi:acyl carrier protein
MTPEELRELLSRATGRGFGELKPEHRLADLGLESIDRVRIITRLESRLDRPIDEREAMSLSTVADILSLFRHGTQKPR